MRIGDKIWEQYTPIIKNKNKGKKKGYMYNVYLTDTIEMPAAYNELIYLLRTASKNDSIEILLNNGGGVVDSGLMIVNALRETKAHTTARVSGLVASASTLITLACDDIIVEDFLSFMVHNYSHSVSGGGAQVKEYVTFTDRELSSTIGEIYKNFLTKEEIKSIIEQDREIWLNTEEVKERWNRMKKKTRL